MKYIAILNLIILFSNVFSYEYPCPVEGFYSQKGQDKFLHENIFRGKKNGIFIEIGAHDGISFSNTYFFEKNFGWTGVCVEPNPLIFDKLCLNRNCICEQVCIADVAGKFEPFLKCSGYILEMYSGLLDQMDPRHIDRINKEIIEFGGDKEIIYVKTARLEELFEKHKISQIDLLSIDIEGGEELAIQSINFDKVKISIIVVENNFNEDTVKNFLISKDYIFLKRLGKDDIYQLRECYAR